MSRSALSPIEKTVKNALASHFGNRRAVHLILGASGGIDSTCLLHIFDRLNINITAIHINYQTRGEASEQDAAFVKKRCKKLGIPFIIHTVNSRKADFSNFQSWARKIRYRKFKEVMHNRQADGIAVAHHKNDQVETILQKIFRGAGLPSWSGMQVWDDPLFRPLLSTGRDEIKKYCESKAITFRTDASNARSAYARNFLRNEWLPQLENHFPGWQQNVLRAAKQSDIFKSSLQYILDDIGREQKNGLKRASFLALPLSLQKSLLLFFLRQKAPGLSVSGDALAELNKLPDLQTGKKVQLTDSLALMRDRDVFKPVFEQDGLPEPLLLNLENLQAPVTYYHSEYTLGTFKNPDFNRKLYLDVHKLTWPLTLRPWAEGDKIQPLGMKGHQTVAKHLTNRKISAADKKKAIVVESFEERLAAIIFPSIKNNELPGTIAEKFKCDDTTQKTLIIKPPS